MRVLLMGNPNVGKSAIFSRLTGSQVVVSNYSGTTVEYTSGKLKLESETAELIDVPGTYSLEPTNRAEKVASEMIEGGDVIVSVINATQLERSLYLVLQLLQTGKPFIMALNMWDEAQNKGLSIDTGRLEELTGIPVVPACALTGDGIPLLRNRLPEARNGAHIAGDMTALMRQVADIGSRVQKMPGQRTSRREKLDHATVHPFFGPVLALFVLFISFAIVAFLGDFLHEILRAVFELAWMPVAVWLSGAMGGEGLMHNIFIGGLVDGSINFEESFGLISTGLYIPLAVVLPYIFCFYLTLSILEDVGYLPRLDVVIDAFMQRLGIHGLSVVPMMLGIGCNVPGVMAGRGGRGAHHRFYAQGCGCRNAGAAGDGSEPADRRQCCTYGLLPVHCNFRSAIHGNRPVGPGQAYGRHDMCCAACRKRAACDPASHRILTKSPKFEHLKSNQYVFIRIGATPENPTKLLKSHVYATRYAPSFI